MDFNKRIKSLSDRRRQQIESDVEQDLNSFTPETEKVEVEKLEMDFNNEEDNPMELLRNFRKQLRSYLYNCVRYISIPDKSTLSTYLDRLLFYTKKIKEEYELESTEYEKAISDFSSFITASGSGLDTDKLEERLKDLNRAFHKLSVAVESPEVDEEEWTNVDVQPATEEGGGEGEDVVLEAEENIEEIVSEGG